jgi:hypothetical protein
MERASLYIQEVCPLSGTFSHINIAMGKKLNARKIEARINYRNAVFKVVAICRDL